MRHQPRYAIALDRGRIVDGEVKPGITAAIAAAAILTTPTHRHCPELG